jgi:WD40 repeat protein
LGTGKQTRTIDTDVGSVLGLAFSPDGASVAAGGTRGLQIIDWRTGQTRLREDELRAVDSLAFSPDGERLAAASNNRIRIWVSASGEQLGELDGHGHQVHSVSWSATGRYLVSTGQDMQVVVWDPQTGRPVQHFTTEYPSHGAYFTPDRESLVYNDRLAVLVVPFLPDLWREDPHKLLAEAEKSLGSKLDGFELRPAE